jgi:GT2 family glycosyltransferase
MKTSIIILNYNGKHYIEKFLPDVLQYSYNAEIMVADNGSTDGSVEFLQEKFPKVRLITFSQNYGFAQGYNLAIAQIKNEYCVLLNSDVQVTENWLLTLENYLNQHPEVSVIQPKIKSYTDNKMFEYAGACGGFIDRYGYPFCRGRILQELEIDKGQYDNITDVFWASGAGLMIRTADYLEVGGLDGRFFAHQEEIDLCWRLKARGKNIVCLPQSVVYHVGGGTLNSESPFKTYLNFRNNLFLIYKNMPDNQYFKIMFVRFFLDIAAFLLFVMQGKIQNAKAVIKAMREFKKRFKEFSSDRQNNLMLSIIQSHKEMYKGLIVAKYYCGKRRFNQIFSLHS